MNCRDIHYRSAPLFTTTLMCGASSAQKQGVLYNVSKGLEFHLEQVNLPPGSVTRPLCYTTVHCPLRYCPYQ